MIIKRKRGRPPKIKNVTENEPINLPKKRGRPPKNKLAAVVVAQTVKKRRGRPPKALGTPKAVSVPKAKEARQTSSANENYVTGKLFTHSKRVSKQEPWFEDWDVKFCKSYSQKDWDTVISLIGDLTEKLNAVLKKHEEFKLSVNIPVTRLVQDEKTLQVFFDPINKGAEVHVFYRAKDFPLGLSPSMKATAVCNKLTEIITSFVPIGISG